MPRTYAAGDVMVLPSYGAGETWGLAVNEAMCLGRPVIASDHVGCAADLVKPEQTGLIFPAGDVEALAHCLRRALGQSRGAEGDRSPLCQWGQAGQAHISHYSYDQATEGLLEALSTLAPRRWSAQKQCLATF